MIKCEQDALTEVGCEFCLLPLMFIGHAKNNVSQISIQTMGIMALLIGHATKFLLHNRF